MCEKAETPTPHTRYTEQESFCSVSSGSEDEEEKEEKSGAKIEKDITESQSWTLEQNERVVFQKTDI